MSFCIGKVKIDGQIVVAPMAGISNTTFRSICKCFGAGLVVAEMVSDKAICFQNEKTLELLKMKEDERPISQQIFGSDVSSFVLAAKKVVQEMHPDIIDINMGCPVPKVAIKNQAGSALLKNPDKIKKIVEAVVEAVDVPVTVKIRSGWDEFSINAVEVARICEEAGASAIAIHARTRKQGYSGKADWNIIRDVVNAVSIPVIGNGDVVSAKMAKQMLDETGCKAVMIGRGLLGNPWLVRECVSYLDKGILLDPPSFKEKIDMMLYHLEQLVKDKNEKVAVLEMRTQFMYYLKGLPNAKDLKQKICQATSANELKSLIKNYYEEMKDVF